MLVSIDVVLRFSPALQYLEADCWFITNFLGPPRNMSLSDACHKGSIKLLDWIWSCSCTSVEDRGPRWSLTNYLRSEPLYYSLQFSKPVATAADRGDLEMLKWLFAHFSGCEAPVGAARNAAMSGHLHVLEFLWAHSDVNMPPYKKQKNVDDCGEIGLQYVAEYAETTNSVEWDTDYIIWAAAQCDHFDIVRWLYHNTAVNMDLWPYDLTIAHVLGTGDDELVQLLLPPGRCVLDYAKECPRVEVSELMLDCGYLRRDSYLAVNAIRDLATSGRVDLMEQIVQLNSPLLKRDVGRWSMHWIEALDEACACGALDTVQWLVMQQRLPRSHSWTRIVEKAAASGHPAVVQYLCKQKLDTHSYDQALKSAIHNNRFKCVEVLILQLLRIKQRAPAIDYAAREGSLEMVEFLLAFKPHEVGAEPNQKDLSRDDAWWAQSADLLASAAASGNLQLVKWVQLNHRGENATNAIDSAAAEGHLEVVQWLQGDGTATFSKVAMYRAAASGNLPMVKWIHSSGFTESVDNAVNMAAKMGILDVVKWFYANRPERCTTLMIKDVTRNGPLRAADWLHTNSPECVLTDLDGPWDAFTLCKFEMLLFVDARCPQCFTPRFVMETKNYLGNKNMRKELQWLNARFPE